MTTEPPACLDGDISSVAQLSTPCAGGTAGWWRRYTQLREEHLSAASYAISLLFRAVRNKECGFALPSYDALHGLYDKPHLLCNTSHRMLR